jgi:hypothetical protein
MILSNSRDSWKFDSAIRSTGLLIDYPGAAAAYSLRQFEAYTGSAIGVESHNGSPEYNIGFGDGN